MINYFDLDGTVQASDTGGSFDTWFIPCVGNITKFVFTHKYVVDEYAMYFLLLYNY